MKVTVAPKTEHVPEAENVTTKLDDAVAETANGPGMVFGVIAAKVIVCADLEIDTFFVAVPIAYGDAAGTVAVKAQEPAASPLMTPVAALKVHAPIGFPTAEIVTVPPDGAVAVIGAEVAPTATAEFAEALKVGVLSVVATGASTVRVVDEGDGALSPTKFVAITLTTYVPAVSVAKLVVVAPVTLAVRRAEL